MPDLIELAKGKLNDPILMSWAISRYMHAGKGHPQREAMEQAWFDDLTLRRWLNADNEDILSRLFVNLPSERFSNLGQVIGEHWGHWSGILAYHSAPVLAQYQPELAWKCFAEPQGGRHRDVDSILGVIHALPFLPREDGLQLLKVISQQILKSYEDSFAHELKLSELLSVSLKLDRTVALQVIKAQVKETMGKREWNLLLDLLDQGLFGHSVYRQLASDRRQGETQQSFQQLEVFFRPDAPLGQLDQLSHEKVHLDVLTERVDRFLDEQDRPVIQLIIETLRAKRHAEQQDLLADFLIGVVAAACEREALDATPMSLPVAVQHLAFDLCEPRFFEALMTRLKQFDQQVVAPLLMEALDRERAAYGSIWVAEVMGQFAWHVFITPLTHAMAEDCGDFLCEAAQEALVRIGDPARDHLIRHWNSLDSSQRIYGLTVIEDVGGEPTASFAADCYEALFQEDPQRWCQLTLGAPDRRLLERLEQQMPRQQRLFDETFYQLARLLEVNHPQLEVIAGRVKKAQAEQRAHLAAFQRGDGFNQNLMLKLKCPLCGDVNEYQVRQVAVNPHSKETGLLLADEFPCASCGRWAEFEFTASAHLTITAGLLKLAADNDMGLAGQSKSLVMLEAPYQGRQLPVAEVVSRCKQAIAKHPPRIEDWLRLGLCYHHVLSRPRHALGYAQRALDLEPNAVEAVLQKADAIAMQGQGEAAFQLLDQALESKHQWRFFLTDVASPAQLSAQFARLYNELLGRLGKIGHARLHAAFLGASKKVGRNELCPCGSGKKYKKCCLAKA